MDDKYWFFIIITVLAITGFFIFTLWTIVYTDNNGKKDLTHLEHTNTNPVFINPTHLALASHRGHLALNFDCSTYVPPFVHHVLYDSTVNFSEKQTNNINNVRYHEFLLHVLWTMDDCREICELILGNDIDRSIIYNKIQWVYKYVPMLLTGGGIYHDANYSIPSNYHKIIESGSSLIYMFDTNECFFVSTYSPDIWRMVVLRMLRHQNSENMKLTDILER